MNRRLNNRSLHLAVLAGTVLLTRLPFIFSGYGIDGDAWRVADAAFRIAETGSYVASRLPGYPLYEYLAALLYPLGAVALNTVSALMSLAAVLFFASILRRLGCRDVLLPSIAFALTPAFHINSVSAMDFSVGLALMLGSLYCTLDRRYLLAGLLLGMAVGSRMTWGAMLLPLMILAFAEENGFRRRHFILPLATLIVGGLWYLPPLFTYGWEFFSFADMFPPLIYALYLPTVGFWGTIGVVALSTLVLLRVLAGKNVPAERSLSLDFSVGSVGRDRGVPIASGVAVLLYLIAFIRLPHDASYLLPTLPFVLILLAAWLGRRRFLLLCIALSISPFFLFVDNHGASVAGPILHDHYEREERLDYVERVLETTERLEGRNLVVTGDWFYPIEVLRRERRGGERGESGDAEFIAFPDSVETAAYRERGYEIRYLPDQERHIFRAYGYRLSDLGGRPLPVDSFDH